jgi:hypothetical protein
MESQATTALIILVPEAEAFVKEFRDKYDPSAAEGMPAHITVLFPLKHWSTLAKTWWLSYTAYSHIIHTFDFPSESCKDSLRLCISLHTQRLLSRH